MSRELEIHMSPGASGQHRLLDPVVRKYRNSYGPEPEREVSEPRFVEFLSQVSEEPCGTGREWFSR